MVDQHAELGTTLISRQQLAVGFGLDRAMPWLFEG
jgi:hypothetical protein